MSSSGPIGAAILASSITIRSVVKEPTYGQIDACIRVHGRITKWMVWAFSLGQTAASISDSTITTTSMVKVSSCGPMARGTRESGEKASNMVKESTQCQME